jgi:hypothetical protein
MATMDSNSIRKYLLGGVNETEELDVEAWLISTPEALDELNAAEDDLIDDAIQGKLTRRELQQFRNRFLAAPERQQKFEFARSFHDYIHSTHRQQQSLRERIEAFLFQSRWRYATPVLAGLLLVATAWSVFRIAELEIRVADRAPIPSAVQQPAQEQVQSSASVDPTAGPSRLAPGNTLPPPVVAILLPGILRDGGEAQTVTVPAGVPMLVHLALVDDLFDNYGVVMTDSDRREILKESRLQPQKVGTIEAVSIAVPPDVLQSGEYTIKLSGELESGAPEPVASYYLRLALTGR